MPPQIALYEAPAIDGVKIAYRAGRRKDDAFVIQSWLSSMKDSMVESRGRVPDLAVRVTGPVYFAGQHARIERFLADPATQVKCVTLLDDLDVILGWAASHGDCLHYVFVKDAWRRRGLGESLIRALLPQGVKRFSMRTQSGDSFLVPKIGRALYDPFAIDTVKP